MKKIKDIRAFFKKPKSPLAPGNEEMRYASSPNSSTNLQTLSNTSEENISIVNAAVGENCHQLTVEGRNTGLCEISEVVALDTSEPFRNEKRCNLDTLQAGPSQPYINFPKTKIGNNLRSFSSKFYQLYSWLEYNCEDDKAYCFVCRHFTKEGIRDQNEAFAKNGYNNWKKLGERLKRHAESLLHVETAQKYVSYQKSLQTGDVYQQVLMQQEQDVVQNREYLMKLIDIILTLVRQGLPLRGHHEDKFSKNTGNFLEIAQVLSKFDKKFSAHFEKHFNYCSPDIQNEIITIIASLAREIIVKEVKACGFFSLSVDEARCYKAEQLSITIRYANKLNVEEKFIAFIDCSLSRDAQGLVKLILEALNKYQLSSVPILAQSYDGASVMSGKNRGLQAIIKEIYPHAIYIHCLAYKLNLVVVDSCANIPLARTFFNGIESLCIHFAQPGHHASLAKIHQSLGINANSEIRSLSTTRWSCRYENCKVVLNNFEAIIIALSEEIVENRDKYAVEALGLLSTIEEPEFIVALHTFLSVLATVNALNKYFQAKNATLAQASDLIVSTIKDIEESRSEFKIWKDVEKFAENQGVSLEPINVSKRRLQRKDFYTESNIGKSTTLESPTVTRPEDYWRINIYNQVVDNIIVNLKHRIENHPLASAIDAFLELDMEKAENCINNYKCIHKIDTTALNAEAAIMKNMLQLKNCAINLESLKMHIKQEFCPNAYKLRQAAIAFPVSSVSCERSFSAMRRIKTWLRTTMLQHRFSDMSFLHIENEMIKNAITSEAVLNKFTGAHRELKLI